jgi:hypothetical protein
VQFTVKDSLLRKCSLSFAINSAQLRIITILQGGSDISGTHSKLYRRIKKSTC